MSFRKGALTVALLCVSLAGFVSTADTTIDFRGIYYRIPYTAAVADLNGDGWLDVQ